MSWRAIQDTVPASESLAGLSDFGERLYWRILSQVDPWGRLPGSPAKVRALCAPLLPHATTELVANALDELEQAGRVERHTVEATTFLQVLDFARHQPADVLGREGRRYRSSFPAPPEPTRATPRGAEQRGVPPAPTRGPRSGETPHLQGTPRHSAERGVTPRDSAVNSNSAVKATGSALKRGPDTPPQLPSSNSLTGELDLDAFARALTDADERTPMVLAGFRRRGLPEAAFHTALESLQERKARTDRRPLRSEVRYFVSALKTMVQEGQYTQ